MVKTTSPRRTAAAALAPTASHAARRPVRRMFSCPRAHVSHHCARYVVRSRVIIIVVMIIITTRRVVCAICQSLARTAPRMTPGSNHVYYHTNDDNKSFYTGKICSVARSFSCPSLGFFPRPRY